LKTTKEKNKQIPTVLVIGGYGFIGRSIVAQLESLGASVLIGSRCLKSPRQLGTRRVVLHELNCQQQCEKLLEGVDIVINAVGILRQRTGETYEQVHHLAVEYLVNACAKKRIRFLHVSALGLLNPTRSRFLSSKLKGELVIQNSGADWAICRSSLVDGEGGYGAKWFRRVANWPIHFSPANAVANLAPINVLDLGEAIAKIALQVGVATKQSQRIYELGGDQQMSVLEYQQILKKGRPLFTIKVPAWIARLASHLLDFLHLTPFSFGHYELLKFDNCPKKRYQTELLLGRACRLLGKHNENKYRLVDINLVKQ